MEGKKEPKINAKITGVIIYCFIMILVAIAFIMYILNGKTDDTEVKVEKQYMTKSDEIAVSDTLSKKMLLGEYVYIIKGDYKGQYELQYITIPENEKTKSELEEEFEKQECMNYETYKEYCDKWGIKTEYTDETKNYIVFSYLTHGTTQDIKARLADVEYDNDVVELYVWDDEKEGSEDNKAYVIVVPTDKEIRDVDVLATFTDEEYIQTQPILDMKPYETMVDKPIIYLYPTEEKEISVKLGKPEEITCSYPKYTTGWNVLAKPNGELTDLTTNKNLYALYYESNQAIDFKVEKDGFVVKGTDSAKFLEEKLATLGLTDREAEEFIVYWLPKLEANEYNYIRFATKDEIEENMPLEILEQPDTLIRVLMTYKGLETPIDVQEQQLETPERNGFVAVEWGGTEIK